MKTSAFLYLLIICTITHIIRTVYEVLKHRKALVPGRLSFVIIFTNMAVLWVSWFALCANDILKVSLPDAVRYTGALLVVTGLIFFITALFTIKTLESYEGDLITSGIYSKIRHPMYLAFILWMFGSAVYYGAAISFIFVIIFTGNVLLWRHLEELELVDRFPDYKCYREKTLF